MKLFHSNNRRSSSSQAGFFPLRNHRQSETRLLEDCNLMPSILGHCLRPVLFVWLLLATCSTWAQNAFSPGGPEFSIAGPRGGDQTAPHAAVNTSGGVLVWQDNALSTNGLAVNAIRLTADFQTQGPSFRVNFSSVGEHEKPQVALLQNGGAVIVWQGGRFGFQKVYARFLGSNGTNFLSDDILVNTYTNAYQITPAVASLTDGTVVIVWASADQDGSLQGVFGQRFTVTGQKLGTEFQVNQFSSNNQRTPSVAALANGKFVVAWVSELQRASSSVDIYARLYDPAGTPVGNEFPVNPVSTNLCANPSVAAAPDGSFAIAWSQKDALNRNVSGDIQLADTSRRTNGWDVYARLYKTNGQAAGTPIRLNTLTYGDQFAPKLQAFGRNYLATWLSLSQDGSREGVFGQFFNNDGSLAGVEFAANTSTASRQIHPAVATDGANRFLVLWTSFTAGTSFDLMARSYDIIRTAVSPTSGGMQVSWNAQPGCMYQIQISSDLKTWSDLGSTRTATTLNESVVVGLSQGVAYYRVVRIQ